MPKARKSQTMQQAEIVQKNILSRGAYFGFKYDREYAERLGVSTATFNNRRKSPQHWTLEQLIHASIAFNCSLSWLFTDHSKENAD